jgi:hypothetical protein
VNSKQKMTKMPAYNERFASHFVQSTSGATAAGSANVKGSAEIPPLRQAAIPLCVSTENVVEKVSRSENRVPPTMP